MKVKNSESEIEKVLRLDKGSCKHAGNFHFRATLNGHKVLVNAYPVDEYAEYIDIYSMEM